MASRRVDGGCDTSRPRGRRLGRGAGAARRRRTAGGPALLHVPDGHWAWRPSPRRGRTAQRAVHAALRHRSSLAPRRSARQLGSQRE
eukprot:scaffold41811_cov38-Phaeocystis_antarctica.AAC.1